MRQLQLGEEEVDLIMHCMALIIRFASDPDCLVYDPDQPRTKAIVHGLVISRAYGVYEYIKLLLLEFSILDQCTDKQHLVAIFTAYLSPLGKACFFS